METKIVHWHTVMKDGHPERDEDVLVDIASRPAIKRRVIKAQWDETNRRWLDMDNEPIDSFWTPTRWAYITDIIIDPQDYENEND